MSYGERRDHRRDSPGHGDPRGGDRGRNAHDRARHDDRGREEVGRCTDRRGSAFGERDSRHDRHEERTVVRSRDSLTYRGFDDHCHHDPRARHDGRGEADLRYDRGGESRFSQRSRDERHGDCRGGSRGGSSHAPAQRPKPRPQAVPGDRSHGQSQGSQSSGINARMLTSMLKQAGSVGLLLHLVDAHGDTFNQIHCSAAWSYLGKQSGECHRTHHQPGLKRLLQLTETRVTECGGRALANVAHGIAKSRVGGADAPALLDAIAAAAAPRLSEFSPQALGNTAWAFATARHDAPALLEAIAAKSSGDDLGDAAATRASRGGAFCA